MNKYERVILQDVNNPKYDSQANLVWKIFGFFGVLFLGFYIFFFHEGLLTYWGFVLRMYRASLSSSDANFKTFVYIYNHLFLFLGFVGFVSIFAVLAGWAFDMQARNRVIRRLLADAKPPDSTP